MGPASGERFTPDALAADRAEAASLSRYRWAAGCLPSGRVLDAGCGPARGTAVLRESSSGSLRTVTGVDVSAPVLDAARATLPPDVTLEPADVCALPYEAGSFDGAVCFDVLEHVEKPARALDELRRVLHPGGMLAVSVSGGIEGEVLGDLLRDRFAQVRLFTQHEWLAVGVVEPGGESRSEVAVPEVAPRSARTLALASDAALPATRPDLVLGPTVDVDQWTEAWAEQETVLRSRLDQIALIERSNADIQALNRRLLDAEQRVAQVAQQRQAIARLTDEHTALEETHKQLQLAYRVLEEARLDLARELDVARALLADAEQQAELERQKVAALQASTSWRVTRPLRWISGRVRRCPDGDALGD